MADSTTRPSSTERSSEPRSTAARSHRRHRVCGDHVDDGRARPRLAPDHHIRQAAYTDGEAGRRRSSPTTTTAVPPCGAAGPARPRARPGPPPAHRDPVPCGAIGAARGGGGSRAGRPLSRRDRRRDERGSRRRHRRVGGEWGMAMTGWPMGRPMGPPAGSGARATLGGSPAVGSRSLVVDPLPLLGERAALSGLSARRRELWGRHPLFSTAVGWMAVSLARLEDIDLVPAWLALAGAPADEWAASATRPRLSTARCWWRGGCCSGFPSGCSPQPPDGSAAATPVGAPLSPAAPSRRVRSRIWSWSTSRRCGPGPCAPRCSRTPVPR